MDFSHFQFAPALNKALRTQNYTEPTPIQAQAIPPVLAGRDVIGCAQTGTGKTAAFTLPVLHRLLTTPRVHKRKGPRVLVVAPTRELAAQIHVNVVAYSAGTQLRSAAIYGGVGMGKQIQQLRQSLDVLIACPGRLLDLYGQGHVDFGAVEVLILDEADRMLDMGFLPDIRKIIAQVPERRQTLLFSATMAKEIRGLAEQYLKDPVSIAVTPVTSTADTVSQELFHVERGDKTRLLCQLIKRGGVDKAVVFTRTKHGADRLVRKLDSARIRANAIHGNKSQGQRTRAMDQFRDGTVNILVASDIAARGLDVQGISHVVNFDMPQDSDTYIHRIGRCGRAGASGVAWSMCAPEERGQLRDLQRDLKRELPVADWEGSAAAIAAKPVPKDPSDRRHQKSNKAGGRRGGNKSGGSRTAKPAGRQDGNRRQAGRRRSGAAGR